MVKRAQGRREVRKADQIGQDHNTDARKAFIASVPRETRMRMQVEQRKAEMGEKYLCHPSNHVKRIAVKSPVLR